MGIGEILEADWQRLQFLAGLPQNSLKLSNYFSPRFAPVVLIRLANSLYKSKLQKLAKLFSLINFVIFGIEVPARLDIAPGLVIHHTQGTILGAASIGKNVTIFQQVTVGATEADYTYSLNLRPTIGNNVTLGAGAKILGGITLHDGAVIGANAVVLKDVPAGYRAVGVPAEISPIK